MALKSKAVETVREDVPVDKVAATADGGDLVRVNLVVPKETRTGWRAEALRRDIPLAELIRQAMSHYINK
mgnify:CR=1 FL=1